MEDYDYLPKFSKCPRCFEKTYDVLRTHSYCVDCNFSPTYQAQPNYAIPAWAFDELAKSKTIPGIGRAKTEGGGL